MNSSKDSQYKLKINNREVLVDGRKFKLLKFIDQYGSITKASKEADIPYRTALKYIENIELELNTTIVSSKRGGKGGGGESELTDQGKNVLKEYIKFNSILKMHNDANEIESNISDINLDHKIVNIKLNGKKVVLPLRGNFSVGDRVLVLISPEDIFVTTKPQESHVRNIFEGKITFMGQKNQMIRLNVAMGEINLKVDVNENLKDQLNLTLGKKIYIGFKAAAITMIKI